MNNESRVRADNTCPLCLGVKDKGLVLCWPCHRREKAANDGCYSAFAERRVAAREQFLAGGNLYKDALDVQDACNLRAIARLLVRSADAAADAGGTDASYRDAAVVLIVGKIESLVHSDDRFSAAYDECLSRS